MVTLSKRLQALAAMVRPCRVLADIGCDHAFLAIYLVQRGLAEHVIAADINYGPLLRAQEHILANGLQDRITTVQCDGLSGIHYADTIVIAGMGGFLMYRILTDHPQIRNTASELILQPQSEIAMFRSTLTELGYRIVSENLVIEDGKFYPMMKAVTGQMSLTETECKYGPLLLAERNENLYRYLLWEHAHLTELLDQLQEAGTQRSGVRRVEVEAELAMNREVLSNWGENHEMQ